MKNGNGEGLIILVVLIIIVLIMPKTETQNSSNKSSTLNNNEGLLNNISNNNQRSNISVGSAKVASYRISLGGGNARNNYQPYQEYVTITNSGKNSVNITGWQLKNAKSTRAYNVGANDLRFFASDVATIPQATIYLSPTGQNYMQNVELKTGERAIVTTGKMGVQNPYKIVSFKENICTGYLENMDEYSFTPALTKNCPRPANEVGVNLLDTECRKFIERLQSCKTPDFDTRDSDGYVCPNCVNGKALSNACVTFIKSHFSYPACLIHHGNDANFSLKTWRIFLGQSWEMWAKDYETIKLFDRSGTLVKELSY